ncbi:MULTISPECIES: GNAT family N-acetyltransferase [Clostridium]|uniref:Acetyltransferase n=2 Tax=Clostridium novyi TaxID=1542 RepID=A0Q0L8_CLONN|nr:MULTISPECIES: GNAT family N-acetyltransferase [Clostridium]ABK61486.1 acetyltransferase [Clostridium novyi NT]KEH84868.1 acetyltransferase [Clostridium novyi A str. NCTC 538]KEH85058.1 acetyltransferase [Clostridium novyi A str. 4540]KEH92190.1 acetyltransferase [Clostridium botulinum C/D str. It1]
MYTLEVLTKENLNEFNKLNEFRTNFNKLNKDFWQSYYTLNNMQILLLRKKIKLLKKDFKYIGYVWIGGKVNNIHRINSMYIVENDNILNDYSYLINNLDLSYPTIYTCEKNHYNFDILNKIGFEKIHGIMEMSQNLNSIKEMYVPSDIKFKKFIRGKDEAIRCFLQNTIFESKNRLPLTIKDIYYDEMQDYYCEDSAIFLKQGNSYIGYGQIIEKNKIPFIVNLGILPQYQNQGYGTLLLKYLLNMLYKKKKSFVKINVDPKNIRALELYKLLDFKEDFERSKWYLSNI